MNHPHELTGRIDWRQIPVYAVLGTSGSAETTTIGSIGLRKQSSVAAPVARPGFTNFVVLDIGCGTGFFIDRWKSGVKRIVGIDITQVAVEKLRRQYPYVELHQMDIGDGAVGLSRNTFDAVSAFDVLYHIVDDAKYFAALGNIDSL